MSTVSSDIPTSTLNLQDLAFIADPYPALREIQEAGPVVYHEGLGQYMVSRWSDCAKILGNSEKYRSEPVMFQQLFGGDTMIGIDDSRHALWRGVWAKDFVRGSVETKRAMMTEIVDSQLMPLVERLKSESPLDAIEGAARAIPTIVIARLLGIPEADLHQFIAWSEQMVGISEGVTDPSPHGQELIRLGMEASVELNGYLRTQYLGRRDAPRDDLISRLVQSPVSDDMTERDIVASYAQLAFAGNETTPRLMANVLLALAQHPDQRELLRTDRSLIPQAVEEINRWMAAAIVNWRVVRPGGGGGDIAGVEVPEGRTLLLLQGIANRDPRRWDDPDRLDILRPPLPNFGFGFGTHLCLGLHVARMETQIWLERLLDEIPDWHVVDVDWGASWVAHGPVGVDITP